MKSNWDGGFRFLLAVIKETVLVPERESSRSNESPIDWLLGSLQDTEFVTLSLSEPMLLFSL